MMKGESTDSQSSTICDLRCLEDPMVVSKSQEAPNRNWPTYIKVMYEGIPRRMSIRHHRRLRARDFIMRMKKEERKARDLASNIGISAAEANGHGACSFCGKLGHIVEECRYKRRMKEDRALAKMMKEMNMSNGADVSVSAQKGMEEA